MEKKLAGYEVCYLSNNLLAFDKISVDNVRKLFDIHNVLNCSLKSNRLKSNIVLDINEYPRYQLKKPIRIQACMTLRL